MFCSQCGKKLSDSARFCDQCGAPTAIPMPPEPAKEEPLQPEPPQQETPEQTPEPISAGPDGVDAALREMNLGRKGGRLAGFLIGIVVLAVVFALVLALKVSLPSGDMVEGPGFDTAEEAAEAYLDALKDGDLDGMLATFAMETYVENMDLTSYVERLQVYVPMNMPLPGDSELIQKLNLEKRRSTMTQYFTYQYLTLLDPDSPMLELTPLQVDEGKIAAYLSGLEVSDDLEKLSRMVVGSAMAPEMLTDSYYQESNQENLRSQAACYGADEIQSLALQVTVDGRNYFFCPDLIRYGDTWYVLSPMGNLGILLGGAVTTGGFVPADEIF